MEKQMELNVPNSQYIDREDKPKRSKKVEEPKQKLGERCVICSQVFAKRHPIECRCICDKCASVLRKIIDERRSDEI